MRWLSLVVISCGVGCTLLYETLFCHQGLMTYLELFSTDDQTSLSIILLTYMVMMKIAPRRPLEGTWKPDKRRVMDLVREESCRTGSQASD
jgi:hypothetical protein